MDRVRSRDGRTSMGQRLFAATAALLVVACAACQSEGSSAQVSPTSAAAAPSAAAPAVVASDLDVPWGIAFLPDGTALIAERDSGAIRHLQADGSATVIGEVPGVSAQGESGLLGLAVSPN